MNQHEMTRHVRRAFAPDAIDPAAVERVKRRSLALLDDLADAESRTTRTRSRRPSTPRMLLAAAILATIATVAVAQPGPIGELFGSDPSTPANQIDVLKQPPADEEAAAVLEVFQRPDRYPDSESSIVRDQVQDLTQLAAPEPEGWGEPLPDYLRTFQVYRTAEADIRVVGMPTSRGYVCYVTWIARPRFGSNGTCVSELTAAQPVDVGLNHAEGVYTLSGIASDDVARIRVELASGASAPATMGSNAFIWRGIDRPTALHVELEDGSVVRLDPAGRG